MSAGKGSFTATDRRSNQPGVSTPGASSKVAYQPWEAISSDSG